MKDVIEHLERMAETLDRVTEENWLDTPQDIAQIYRSVANEIKQKMSAQNKSVTNCNQLKILDTLKNIKQEAETTCAYIEYPIAGLPGERSISPVVFSDWLIDECNSALAKTPRNCDVYETKAERQSAFINWYNEAFGLKDSKYAIDTCDLKHNIDDILHEYIDWFFAEAEGEAK